MQSENNLSEYKICIIGAGKGSRNGIFTDIMSKALLPIHGKPTIAYIVEQFDSKVEIVFAIGYKGDQIMAYLEKAYPKRKFTWVQIENFEGPGSGPGLTLLKCQKHLRCPFIFTTIDTLVLEKIPVPDKNWFGVAEVEDTSRFSSVKVVGKKVVRLDDKKETNNKYAFIGLAGIFDHETFWESLAGNDELKAGERQVSNGFESLIEPGLNIVVFTWFDTGTKESYQETCESFPN